MAIISSGIWDIDPTVTDGTQLAGYLNELVAAINTNQSSATRPPMIKKGGIWTKTLSGSDIAVMVYDGTTDYEIGKIIGGDIQLDSIWTEVGDVAVYDGDIKVNGVTVGKGTGSSNTNTIVGKGAFANNTDGSSNVAVGISAMRDNQTGGSNTAIGRYSGQLNVDGNENTYVGQNSGRDNVSGIRNTAVGSSALVSNTARENTAIGWNALTNLTIGSVNTGVGDSALKTLTEGSENQAFGNASLSGVTTGSSNTGVGRSAGSTMTTGSNNTCIGYKAQPSAPGVFNEVTIGNDDVVSTRLKGRVLLNDNWNGGADNKNGLGIATSTSSNSAYAMYIRNTNGNEIFTLRCDGSTRASKLYLGDDKVDLRAELNLKDKLIEKLEARLKNIEDQLKKKKK